MLVSRLPLLILLAAIGCESVDLDDIKRHQQSWREADIQDYVFVSYVGCFCDIADNDGIRHEVRDGVAVSAVGAGTGLPFDEEATTIDAIFERALASAREDPDDFKITYDETHAFIRELEVDPDSDTEDDGYSLEVRCFSTDVDAGCPVATLSDDECAEAGGTPRDVDRTDRWLTCDPTDPQPIGRISDTDQVCCIAEAL